MASNQPTGVTPARSQDTKNVAQAFESLGTDDKLALLYYIYEKMGDSITPAAPTAADAEISPQLLQDFFNLSDDQQLAAMREIVNREDTQVSRAYGALSEKVSGDMGYSPIQPVPSQEETGKTPSL